MKRHPLNRTAAVLSIAVALVGGACGPDPKLELGVRESVVNIRLGDGKDEAPGPPALGVPVTGPSLTGAAVPLDLAEGPEETVHPVTGRPLPAPRPCPTARTDAPVEAAAEPEVTDPPVAGTYRYRRSGTLRVGAPGQGTDALTNAPTQSLSSQVVRTITNVAATDVEQADKPRITFDVVQLEPGVRTTTSYVVEPVGAVAGDPFGIVQGKPAAPGLKITGIKLERADLPGSGLGGAGTDRGVEVFNPQPAVKLMNLPAGGEPPPPPDATGGSRGVDPDIVASLEVFSATTGRANVDVCGRVLQGWRVQVSFSLQPEDPRQSTYDRRDVRSYSFSGEFVFAPQLALVLSDRFLQVGVDGAGRPYSLESSTTLSTVTPAP